VIYLWNPLLIWETYLGGHLDLAAAALAMVGVWMLTRRRFALAAVGFVLAAGVKLWSLLLLAFLARPLWGRWRPLAVTAIAAAVLLVAMGWLFATSLGPDSGLASYSRTRFANPGVFWLLRDLYGGWGLWSWYPGDPDVAARVILATVLLAATFGLAWGAGVEAGRVCRRMGLVAMLMLLLSPTLYPWYYIAVIPLATVGPSPAALVWTVLLPVCYWQVGDAREPMRWALAHAPVWVVLGGQCLWQLRVRRRRTAGLAEGR